MSHASHSHHSCKLCEEQQDKIRINRPRLLESSATSAYANGYNSYLSHSMRSHGDLSREMNGDGHGHRRKRKGPLRPLRDLFWRVAVPVAAGVAVGGFLVWRYLNMPEKDRPSIPLVSGILSGRGRPEIEPSPAGSDSAPRASAAPSGQAPPSRQADPRPRQAPAPPAQPSPSPVAPTEVRADAPAGTSGPDSSQPSQSSRRGLRERERERDRSRDRARRTTFSPVTTVTLRPGQTIGDVVVQYMGAYTVENMQVMEDLNPHLGDLDQVKPGDTVQVWDRRRGVFEPEGAVELPPDPAFFPSREGVVGSRGARVGRVLTVPDLEVQAFLEAKERGRAVESGGGLR